MKKEQIQELLDKNENNEADGLRCLGRKKFEDALKLGEEIGKTAVFKDDPVRIGSVLVVFE